MARKRLLVRYPSLGVPAPYREPATCREVLTRPPGFARRPPAFPSIAMSGAACILVLGGVDVAALAALGILALSGRALSDLRARYREASLMRFLGEDGVIVEPGRWTSRDRTRRVRVTRGDARLRFEYLDSERTLKSIRGPSPIGPRPGEREAKVVLGVARLNGRALAPRCFEGLPAVLGGHPVVIDAAAVRLHEGLEGTLAVRLDARGGLLGDTLHPDRRAAEHALEAEYGAHLGRWRHPDEVERDDARAWGEPARDPLAL